MTGIELYSTTAANNNSAPPNGWPEGQLPSSVNDCARQMMAAIRTWYETAEWINFGDTPTYIGATQFSVPTNLTTRYQVGRRVKAVGTTPFTIYGTITVSAYASVTTVTVVWDSGSLNGTLTTIYVGSPSVTNPSISTSCISGFAAALPPYTAASSSGPATLTFAEDTDNGTNKITLTAPSAITADVSLTMPDAAGTIARTQDKLSAFAATTSAELRGVISDETGTGVLVFAGGNIGAATATTASSADNSTKVATTAYVDATSGLPKINTAAFSKTSNTTMGDITGLSWVLGTGTYIVEFYGDLTCASAGGLKIGGAFSGTATGKYFSMFGYDGATAINFPTSTTPFTALGTTGVTVPRLTGRQSFVVTVGGTYTLQMAQAVSNGTSTTIPDGQFTACVRKV